MKEVAREPEIGLRESFERWSVLAGCVVPGSPRTDLRRIQVASWHLPSGLFWLLSILSDLDLYAFVPATGHWVDRDGKPNPESHLARHLLPIFPGIRRRMESAAVVPQDPAFELTHSFPVPRGRSNPSVILYRNLFGALSSHHRRHDPNATFRAFCARPHSEATLLSLPDYWAIFYATWFALRPAAMTFSFDFGKAHSLPAIRRFLEHVSVWRSDDDIERAVAASDPAGLQKADPSIASRFAVRRGDPAEYLGALSDADIGAIRGAPIRVMDALAGRGGLIERLSDSVLIADVESFTEVAVPDDLRAAFSVGDLVTLSQLCRSRHAEHLGSQLIALAASLCARIVGPAWEHQECYADPDAPLAFKTILSCLAAPSQPDLVRKFAAREIGRPVPLLERLTT